MVDLPAPTEFARLRSARAVLHGLAMRFTPSWLSLVLLVGCSQVEDVVDPVCEDGAELLEVCRGAVPDGFFAACEEDPTRAEELIAAECPPELAKADGWLGWKRYGERCWFNWECDDGMECRPLDYPSLSDQACLEPGQQLGRVFLGDYCGEWCDDDDDCADGLLCRNEDIFTNGMCVSHDKQVDSQAMCAVDFH